MTPALWTYWLGSAAAWGALTVLAWRLVRGTATRTLTEVSEPRAVSWRVVVVVLGVAAFARFVLALGPAPLLSDDVHRYIHDGYFLVEGQHPYAESPRAFADRKVADGVMRVGWSPPVELINNPALVTIYQPTSQMVFAVLGFAAHATWRVIDPVDLFRLGFVLIDLGVIALLLLALRQAGRSAWWAALYAWHPLAITETAWSGHQDVIGIACVLGALLLTTHTARATGRRPWGTACLAGLCFALAIGVKPLVLPLALPLTWALRRDRRLIAAAAGATLIGLAALYLPLALWQPGLGGMLETARVFVGTWASNASLHRVAEWALGDKTAADGCMAALLALILLAATFTTDLRRAVMVYLLAGVLLSSTAHPWYLLWALALLPLAFSWGAWVLSLTITLAYTAAVNAEAYQPLGWAVWAAYVPVYGVLVWELARWLGKKGSRTGGQEQDNAPRGMPGGRCG